MGEPNLQLLSFMAVSFGIRTFIETGTAHGATALKASKIFPNVHTIELADGLYKKSSVLLSGKASCYHGRSVDALKKILPPMAKNPVVYWLDAHYSGGPTAGAGEQCALLDEIGVINARPDNNDFIIIDDAHVFFSPAVYGQIKWLDIRQWPDIQEIFGVLAAKDRYTCILSSWRCMEHGVPDGIVMPEDAILSVPNWAREQLYDWLRWSLILEH